MTSTDRSRTDVPGASADRAVLRFTVAERLVHRTTAWLMIICIVTAAVLYNNSLSIRVGHRHLVELVHVYCGFALPVPLLVGLVSYAYRADLRRLGRITPADRRWLRSKTRRDGRIRVGKFNAGQKLNASLACGSIFVLLGTGVLMYFVGLAPLATRTGATFVHDWFSLGLGLLVVGHITFAIKDPESRRGMRTGRVSKAWAHDEHAAWLAEVERTTGDDAT